MQASAKKPPAYRHYKPKDLAVVRIEGRDHYLGKFGSPESYEKYHRILAERYAKVPTAVANKKAVPRSEVETVTELCVGYYTHACAYYTKHGKPTSQVVLIKLALKTLRS